MITLTQLPMSALLIFAVIASACRLRNDDESL